MSYIPSISYPIRLLSTRSGLYVEWALYKRSKIGESFPVILDYEHLQLLLEGYSQSLWRPPPSIRKPDSMKGCNFSLKLEDLSVRQIQSAWLAALRRRFGADRVKLALRVFGVRINLWHLNQVAAHFDVLNQRIEEMPQLGPLLAADAGMWKHLPNWKVVKNRYMAMGLSASAWRWLCNQNRAYVSRLDWTNLGHLAWVNLHSSLNFKIQSRFFDKQTAAIHGFGGMSNWLRRNPDRFSGESTREVQSEGVQSFLRGMRLCLKRLDETVGRENQQEIIQEEFPLILDWMLAQVLGNTPKPVRIHRGWTYDTLMGWQSRWHLSDFGQTNTELNVYWPEILGMGQLLTDYEYFELSSLRSLLQEAKRMHHCVPSYIDRCMDGQICLFHLSRKGNLNERATLEISRQGARHWQITQLKGPCNAPVSDAMWKTARSLLDQVNPR